MLSEVNSAESQKNEKEAHSNCETHLYNISCAEYGPDALLRDSNFMVLVQVKSEPEECSAHAMA